MAASAASPTETITQLFRDFGPVVSVPARLADPLFIVRVIRSTLWYVTNNFKHLALEVISDFETKFFDYLSGTVSLSLSLRLPTQVQLPLEFPPEYSYRPRPTAVIIIHSKVIGLSMYSH